MVYNDLGFLRHRRTIFEKNISEVKNYRTKKKPDTYLFGKKRSKMIVLKKNRTLICSELRFFWKSPYTVEMAPKSLYIMENVFFYLFLILNKPKSFKTSFFWTKLTLKTFPCFLFVLFTSIFKKRPPGVLFCKFSLYFLLWDLSTIWS